MQLSDAVKKRIKYYANKNRITMHKLSLDSGIPYSTLNSFLNGKSKSITISTLLHICEGLNIDLAEFFSDNMFTDVEDNN